MKFKHLLLTASVMALFSSCSNDELVSESTSHGDAIAFSVTTTNATRAADYWCNSDLPDYFEVSALYDDATYFDGDVYKAESGKYINADGISRFWPDLSDSKPLNVWAYKVKADGASAIGDAFATFTFNDGAPTITYDMTDKKAAADQHDLLYAYTQVKEKPGYGKTADINFRHALSQIVFYAKCENTKIHVEIEEIALYNAAKKGVFTLPKDANVTNDYLIDHTQASAAKTTGLGTWALTYDGTGEGESFVKSNNYRGYIASCKTGTDLAVVGAGWTNLTDNKNETNDTHTAIEQSLLVLPQTLYTGEGAKDNTVKAYVPKKTDGTYQPLTDQTVGGTKIKGVGGACIAIKCKIQNIAGATYNKATDVYLWGTKDEAKELVVPVDFAWEQGKKYIYKINFSNLGHGGYDPDNGKEVLVPIQLSVSVDDFAEATTNTVNKDI